MDLAIIETLNGGDAQLNGNDFALVQGFENTIYLAMFGGNPGFVTGKREDREQAFDWWGNKLLFNNTPNQQMNSHTQYTLQTVALNSFGRKLIENAIKKDLDFLKVYGKIEVDVEIVSDDRIKVLIKITVQDGTTRISVITFKRQDDGDFYFADFNKEDFVI